MSGEELEIENVDRAERVLTQKYETLSNSLVKNFEKIRHELETYEIGEKILARVGEVMYKISNMDDIKEIEEEVKYLSDTFYQWI